MPRGVATNAKTKEATTRHKSARSATSTTTRSSGGRAARAGTAKPKRVHKITASERQRVKTTAQVFATERPVTEFTVHVPTMKTVDDQRDAIGVKLLLLFTLGFGIGVIATLYVGSMWR